jgi:hypothetical protein
MALFLSEGFELRGAVYISFETSSTFGYGDQGSLYRYRRHNNDEHFLPIAWSDITIGMMTVTSACLKSKGSCTVVSDSTCSCTFSDTVKYILMLYAICSFAQLGVVLDNITMYLENEQSDDGDSKETISVDADVDVEANADAAGADHKVDGSKCTRDKYIPVALFTLSLVLYLLLGAAVFLALEPDNFGSFL